MAQANREPSDEALMARFQRTLDESAFEQLSRRYLGPALGVAARLLGRADSAEDAVQDCFVRLVRSRELYRAGRPFSTWFYTVLRNVCTDALRRRGRERRAMDELARASAEPLAEPPPPADAVELLAELGEGERQAVELRVIVGLSFRDVGAALGVSEEAAKKRAQRGLHRLRERMARRET